MLHTLIGYSKLNSNDNPPRDTKSESETFELLLKQARDGGDDAVGELLDEYRQYLLWFANQKVGNEIRGKLGGSDLVQESLLTAQREFNGFRGDTAEQLKAWLRKILQHHSLQVQRRFRGTAKRQVEREVPIQFQSSLQQQLVDIHNTPKTDALVQEEAQQCRLVLTR